MSQNETDTMFAKTIAHLKEIARPNEEVAYVMLDDSGPYPAIIRTDMRWNGWVIPRFALETVQLIVADLDIMKAKYIEQCPLIEYLILDGESLTRVDPQWADEPGGSHTICDTDDRKLYDIGGMVWCWESVAHLWPLDGQEPEMYPDRITYWADEVTKLIREDIADGLVPSNVRTFSELHSHVDANDYLIHANVPYDGTDQSCELINLVQESVNNRLAARAELRDAWFRRQRSI